MSPAYTAFSFFSAPLPRRGRISPRPALAERSSQREGGDSKIILPGATAPGTPALNRLRRWLSLPYTCPRGGRAFFVACLHCLLFLFCPPSPKGKDIPPPPSQREGGDQSYFMQGASPLASPGMNPSGTGCPCRTGTLAEGLSGWLPARPATAVPNGSACRLCRLPTLPSLSFLPPIPPPALAERSSPVGKGETIS